MDFWKWAEVTAEACRAGDLANVQKLYREREWLSEGLGYGMTGAYHAIYSDNDDVVRWFVRNGANVAISVQEPRCNNLYDLAHRLGKHELANELRQIVETTGPRWRREASQQRVLLLKLYYDKADGLQFNPNDVQRPFLVGGDYDGGFPSGVAGARQNMEHMKRRDDWMRTVGWFQPYLEMMDRKKGFSLQPIIERLHERQLLRWREDF